MKLFETSAFLRTALQCFLLGSIVGFSSCHTPNVVIPPPPTHRPLTIANWKTETGKISGFSSDEMSNPIWTHSGLLFLVYDYNAEGRKAAIGLVSIFGKPLSFESSVPVRKLCQAPEAAIKDGLVAARLVEIPPDLSPCLTYVTKYQEGTAVLNLDPEQVRLGDQYLILLSTTDSDPFSKKNTASCTIIDGKDKATGQAMCKLDAASMESKSQWDQYLNRAAILIGSMGGKVPESVGDRHSPKENSPQNQLSSEQEDRRESTPSHVVGPHLEKKYQVLMTEQGTALWYLVGFNKEKHPWVHPGELVSIYPMLRGRMDAAPIGISEILNSTSEDSGSVRVKAPCLPRNRKEPSVEEWKQWPVEPLVPSRMLTGQLGHCFAQILSKKPTRSKQVPPTIQLNIGVEAPSFVMVGDIYELRPLPEKNSTLGSHSFSRCQIVSKGTNKKQSRCAFMDSPPEGPLQNYYAVYSTP